MATLSKKNKGAWQVQFRDDHGKRKTISLGNHFTEKTANELKGIVEKLLVCQANSTDLDRRSTVWLETASVEIRGKLSAVGLIVVPPSHTLKELWDTFLAYKVKHVKESTYKTYESVWRRFFLFFGKDERLDDLTKDRMQAWKDHLLDEVEGPTVANYMKETKAVFNWAKAKGWIETSPLTGVGTGSFVNKANDRIIPMSSYFRMLDACPCQDWRCIIALVRIGGLRCPNEVLRLRWEDVNWEHNRFFVRSPKTEHHEGKEGRTVPIFPELKTELEALFFDPASEGRSFVINRYRDSRQNLRTTLGKIVRRAGLEMFPRPFVNMRMTRSNEVYREFGAFAESQWIGHSSRIRADHYLMITDEDFEKASQWSSFEPRPNYGNEGRPKRRKTVVVDV